MAGLEGQTLGSYEVLAKLGQGGMGAVYKARDIRLQRFVAIKVLPVQLAIDEEFVQRFQREAIAAAQFCHSNLVQVFDIGESRDIHFIIMELVEGESLGHRLQRKGRMPPREAIAVTTYIGQALAYAWNKAKLIHRDIKPANIFLSKDGEVKLGDLGLAKSLQDAASGLTLSGTIMGTPHYMSPEQGRGDKQLDCRSDIYSLGCVLYHMLTGDPPYQGDSTATLIYKHVHEAPPSLRVAAPDCPEDLAETVEWMMAKKPEDRPQTYEEMLAELAAVRHALLHAPAVAPKPAAAKPVEPKPVPEKAASHAPVTMAEKKAPKISNEPKAPSFGLIMTGTVVVSVLVLGLFLWAPWASKPPSVVQPPPAAVTQRLPVVPMTATSDAFIKEVAALPAEQQVKRVMAKLKELNPGFDLAAANEQHTSENGAVTMLALRSFGLRDLTPLRAFSQLRDLSLTGTLTPSGNIAKKGTVKELTPLAGMKLVKLSLLGNEITNLAPLKGMPLVSLVCDWNSEITDLTPLAGMPLEKFSCTMTKAKDLSSLKGSRLKNLSIENTPVADLSPVADLPLQELVMRWTQVRDLSPLRKMPLTYLLCDEKLAAEPGNRVILSGMATLRTICNKPIAEFWKQADASKASVTDDAAWKDAINLLPLIDPQKDAVRGTWRKGNTGLAVDGAQYARLSLPYQSPAEYDFLVEFSLVGSGGRNEVTQILSAQGRPFLWKMGAYDRPTLFCFHVIAAGAPIQATTKGSPVLERVVPAERLSAAVPGNLESDQRYISLVKVRKDGVTAWLDGQMVLQCKVDYKYVDMETLWALHDRSCLGVGAHVHPTIFHRIEVREVTGKGTFTRGASAAQAPSSAADTAFVKEVAALPAEQQVKRVVAKLKELNPGYDGKETHKIENGQVTELLAINGAILDLSPVRALSGLRKFECGGHSLPDRTRVNSQLRDLSPLRGLLLTEFICRDTQVVDLSPLAGMPLTTLVCVWSPLNDLSPLKGMPLEQLACYCTQVQDLSPLAGMKLKNLSCNGTRVSSLSPLAGMPLTELKFKQTGVTDLTPLKGMPLKTLWCDFKPDRDAAIVRSITTLENINDQPAEEFWAKSAGRETTKPAASSVEDPARWANAINLLPLIDPQKDVVQGTWTIEKGALVGEKDPYGRIEIPYQPPEEYDYLIEFSGRRAKTGPSQLMAKAGRAFRWASFANSHGVPVFGFDDINGMGIHDNPTKTIAVPMEEGRRYVSMVEVRNDGVRAFLDGKFVVAWKTTYADMDKNRAWKWKLRGSGVLGLGAQEDRVVFHRIEVREVTGKGTFTRGALVSVTDVFVKEVAALPVEEQVKRVVAKVKELNPGFDGKETHTITDDAVIELNFSSMGVTNISPVRALRSLKVLRCPGVNQNSSDLADLSPLRGLRLTFFNCYNTSVRDLTPLQGMPINRLECHGTLVSDLSPLRGMPLDYLAVGTNVRDLSPLKGMTSLTRLQIPWNQKLSDLSPLQGLPLWQLVLDHTPVADLTPLRGAPLRQLGIDHTPIADLTPLKGMPLNSLTINASNVSDLSPLKGMPLTTLGCETAVATAARNQEVLRGIKTLEKINDRPAAEFWKQVDGVKTPSTATRAAPTDETEWRNAINLLPLIDPQKDAVTGTWTRVNSELKVSAGPLTRLQIPYQPPEEYDFQIVFSRQNGEGCIWQILTAGSRCFDWCIAGREGKLFGFELINNKQVHDGPSRIPMSRNLENGQRYTSLVQVRKDGVKGFMDGRLITGWKTDYRDMSLPPQLRLRNEQSLGIGAFRSSVVFHSIEVREVTGKGTVTRVAPAVQPPGVSSVDDPARWANAINLLPLIDLKKDTVRGKWTMEHRGILSDATRNALLEIPYRPAEEYDLHVAFTRLKGKDAVSLMLARAGRSFAWVLGNWGNTIFVLSSVGGKESNANPTAVTVPKCLDNGHVYHTAVEVRNTGVKAYLDDKLITQWPTDYHDLTNPYAPRDGSLLGLCTFESPTVFMRIELVPLTGKGAFTRPGDPAAKAAEEKQRGLLPR